MFQWLCARVTPVSRERYRRTEHLGVVPEVRYRHLEVVVVLLRLPDELVRVARDEGREHPFVVVVEQLPPARLQVR